MFRHDDRTLVRDLGDVTFRVDAPVPPVDLCRSAVDFGCEHTLAAHAG
jgi:hypothetical protein